MIMVDDMFTLYRCAEGVPERVHQKAREVLRAVAAGGCRPKRHRSGYGESLRVGLRYRLFRRDGDAMFTLYSHETYNKICRRR